MCRRGVWVLAAARCRLCCEQRTLQLETSKHEDFYASFQPPPPSLLPRPYHLTSPPPHPHPPQGLEDYTYLFLWRPLTANEVAQLEAAGGPGAAGRQLAGGPAWDADAGEGPDAAAADATAAGRAANARRRAKHLEKIVQVGWAGCVCGCVCGGWACACKCVGGVAWSGERSDQTEWGFDACCP